MAAPSTSQLTANIPEGTEYWVQPCGGEVTGNTPPASDADLAETMSLEVSLALNAVNNWKENFVRISFFNCLSFFLFSLIA